MDEATGTTQAQTVAGDGQAEAAPLDVPTAHNNWERYGLPDDMTGKTFLDVGCWEGVNCAEATKRGASQVVGVDLCTSPDLAANVERFGFEFVQMDILSEKWLELDNFDVVLCGGVLYHVENVISLLFRLRRVTAGDLFLETKIKDMGSDEPLLLFKPSDPERTGNPSNWWVPNRPALQEMLISCGFADMEQTWENSGGGGTRVCIHAKATRLPNYDRVLPRKARRMPLAGGERFSQSKPS